MHDPQASNRETPALNLKHNDSSQLGALLHHSLTLRRQRPRAVDHVRLNRLAVRRGGRQQSTGRGGPSSEKAPAPPTAAALTRSAARNFVRENCLAAAKAGRRAAPTAATPRSCSALSGLPPAYLLWRRIEHASELAHVVSQACGACALPCRRLALTFWDRLAFAGSGCPRPGCRGQADGGAGKRVAQRGCSSLSELIVAGLQ